MVNRFSNFSVHIDLFRSPNNTEISLCFRNSVMDSSSIRVENRLKVVKVNGKEKQEERKSHQRKKETKSNQNSNQSLNLNL